MFIFRCFAEDDEKLYQELSVNLLLFYLATFPLPLWFVYNLIARVIVLDEATPAIEIEKVPYLFTDLGVNTYKSSGELIDSVLTRDFVSNFRCCFCLVASVFLLPSIILLTSCSIARLVTRKASILRLQSLKKRRHYCQINLPKRIKSDSGRLSHHLGGFKNEVEIKRTTEKVASNFWFCSSSPLINPTPKDLFSQKM